MGLVRNPGFDLIRSWRTSPFLSIMVSTFLLVNQELLGAESSSMMTMSPCVKLHLMLDHFCRAYSWGRYSLIHLFQNMSDIYWTCLHLRRAYRSSFWNCPGGRDGVVLRSRRWFGVSASRSLGFVEAFVIGRLLRIASASHKTVWSPRLCTFRALF